MGFTYIVVSRMWVSAAHIRGTQITGTDSFSRNFSEAIESKLRAHSRIFGNNTLEFFAFCINQ